MKRYIILLIILTLTLMGVYLVTLSLENSALEKTLIESQEQVLALEEKNFKVSEEFQVEETRHCRELTLDVLETQAYLDDLRVRKNESCEAVINMPSDLLHPQGYYEVIVDEAGVYTAQPKFN